MQSRLAFAAVLSAIVSFACAPVDSLGGGPSSATGTGNASGSAGAGGAGGSDGAGHGGATMHDGGATDTGAGDAQTNDGPPASDCLAAMPNSLFCNPTGRMPMSLQETGLFPAAPDLSRHAASMLEYVPDPPLWSDGMQKLRFLLLPAGKKIDNSDSKKWIFPVGTIFIKTFFDDTGPGGASRPIETRFIRRVGDATSLVEFDFYVYKWNTNGAGAALVVDDMNTPPNADQTVPVNIKHMEDGKLFTVNGGQPFQHTLPSWKACGDCHTANGMVAQTFIGFDELRLNSKRTPASAKTQLEEFAAAGIFMNPPPPNPLTITDASNDMGRLLRIKHFTFGNCVHCHNGDQAFDLHPDVLVANTVNKAVEAQSVHPPAGWKRIVPKSPGTSVLYVQVERTMIPPSTGNMNGLRPMPPVGVADLAADQAALTDLRDWINSL